jgi:DNA-directed RNA polymerase alpha subunit
MAELAGLGESMIRTLMREGRLRTVAVGKRRLIIVRSYEEFVDELEAAPAQDARRNNAGLPFGSRKGDAKGPAPNIFDRPVDTALNLSTRASNALRVAGVVAVGDLVQQTEQELLKLPNFGRRSLGEVEAALAKLQLRLGMNPDWDRRRDIIAA